MLRNPQSLTEVALTGWGQAHWYSWALVPMMSGTRENCPCWNSVTGQSGSPAEDPSTVKPPPENMSPGRMMGTRDMRAPPLRDL